MADGPRIDVVTPNDFFWKFLSAHTKRPENQLRVEFALRDIVGVDPGETTGLAHWDDGKIYLQQLETKDIGQGATELAAYFAKHDFDHIRCEEYRVYGHMSDQHAWAILHTPQLIGAIKYIAHLQERPLDFKLAQMAKTQWNDDVLKRCGIYVPGQKHARDACRHLCLYMAHPERDD